MNQSSIASYAVFMVLLNVTTTERTDALTGLLDANTQRFRAIWAEIGCHLSISSTI
jgi:hypothetical protein